MSSSPSTGPRSALGTDLRCRSCGSRIRPEATWCSLCHTPVLSAQDESQWAPLIAPGEPVPQASDDNPLASAGQETAAYAGRLDASGESTVGPGAVDPDAVAVARLIAGLAADEAGRRRASRSALLQARFGAIPGGPAMLAAIAGAVLVVIGLVAMTLLGLLL